MVENTEEIEIVEGIEYNPKQRTIKLRRNYTAEEVMDITKDAFLTPNLILNHFPLIENSDTSKGSPKLLEINGWTILNKRMITDAKH